MAQTESKWGGNSLVEHEAGAITVTQTLDLGVGQGQWTLGVSFVDANGTPKAEGDLPTSGVVKFRVKTRATRQWENFSDNEVDYSSTTGISSVTVSGHITAVEVSVTTAIAGATGDIFMSLTAVGSPLGGGA